MSMKLSKQKSLLHVSTLALSGLLFFNMPGVMNTAESHDNTTDVAQAANIEPNPTLAENVSKTNVTVAEKNSQKADTQSTTPETTSKQSHTHQTSSTTSKSEDAGTHHQSEATSYADLPETGHVDHPESGAVIAIIMSIVVSTIALIHVCRQNAQSVISNQDDI